MVFSYNIKLITRYHLDHSRKTKKIEFTKYYKYFVNSIFIYLFVLFIKLSISSDFVF